MGDIETEDKEVDTQRRTMMAYRCVTEMKMDIMIVMINNHAYSFVHHKLSNPL